MLCYVYVVFACDIKSKKPLCDGAEIALRNTAVFYRGLGVTKGEPCF